MTQTPVFTSWLSLISHENTIKTYDSLSEVNHIFHLIFGPIREISGLVFCCCCSSFVRFSTIKSHSVLFTPSHTRSLRLNRWRIYRSISINRDCLLWNNFHFQIKVHSVMSPEQVPIVFRPHRTGIIMSLSASCCIVRMIIFSDRLLDHR